MREGNLYAWGRQVRLLAGEKPGDVRWGDLGVDVVVEATSRPRSRRELERHLEMGARRVLLCSPATDPPDLTVVVGINDGDLRPEHRIVSNSSCTAHAAAPVLRLLDEAFGIERVFLSSVHAYTNQQRLADVPTEDLRTGRAAAENIIPQETNAPQILEGLLPALRGRIRGLAMNVPVPNGSVVDMVCWHRRPVTKTAINEVMRTGASRPLPRHPGLRGRAAGVERHHPQLLLRHLRRRRHHGARRPRLEDAGVVRQRMGLRPPRGRPDPTLRAARSGGGGMTAVRIGINGFGRIGRTVFRIVHERDDIEVVLINDLFDNAQLAYLLKYDTVMGVFPGEVGYDADYLYVDGRKKSKVVMTAERDPSAIPWGKHGVDFVIESTGVFTRRADLEKHLAGRRQEGDPHRAGARRDRRHDRRRRQRRDAPSRAPPGLERVVHHQLPGADRQDPRRRVRASSRG